MKEELIKNLLLDFARYEASLIEPDSEFELSIKNNLFPSILNDIKSIEDETQVGLIYNHEAIFKQLNIHFGGSIQRFFAAIKRHTSLNDEADIYRKITSIENNMYLSDVCHKDPRYNILSNHLDYYIYQLNHENSIYRANRINIKKKISEKVSASASNYVSEIQTDIFQIADNALNINNSNSKGNSFTNKIPGRLNIYGKDE